MFDPENVGRWREQLELISDSGDEVVLASDYDQLLSLYRKQREDLVHIGEVHGVGPFVPKDFMAKDMAKKLDQVRKGQALLLELPPLITTKSKERS